LKKVVLILFILSPLFSNALLYKHDSAQWNFSITPQYLYTNCVRFDIEKCLPGNNWIGLGQQYFYGNINTDNSANGPSSTVSKYNTAHKPDALSGAGFTIDDKIFLHPWPHQPYSNFFFNFGISYARENINFQDNTWVSSVENGLQYYNYAIANGNLKIDDYTFFIAFGDAGAIGDFRLNIILGGAFQTSNTANSGLPATDRNYNRNIFDYQYNGIYPMLTFQLGYLF